MNKRQKKKHLNTMKVQDIATTLRETRDTDVLGSWTGTADDDDKKPVQDADDL